MLIVHSGSNEILTVNKKKNYFGKNNFVSRSVYHIFLSFSNTFSGVHQGNKVCLFFIDYLQLDYAMTSTPMQWSLNQLHLEKERTGIDHEFLRPRGQKRPPNQFLSFWDGMNMYLKIHHVKTWYNVALESLCCGLLWQAPVTCEASVTWTHFHTNSFSL